MKADAGYVCEHGMPRPWVSCLDCMRKPAGERPHCRRRRLGTPRSASLRVLLARPHGNHGPNPVDGSAG